ncbi:MAG: efflux RND transporter periplasmic adaptor subunit [Chromatiaceae bacterium]|nr:efflux RND transporter periplasmic adaptor subunit [Candidatus Thioaporhodococcus sediminis]
MRGLLSVTWMAMASAVAFAQPAPYAGSQPAPYAGSQAPYPTGDFVVRQSEGAPTLSIGGTVIPYKEVTLAAQLPGRVTYLAGIEGDKFKKGDLLVALDDSELLAKRRAILAQMASADAQLRNAGMQYSREIYSPRSKTPPGGMAVPNLFDQMFTRPMESFMGERSEGAELTADLYASGTQIEQARSALMALQAEIQALDSKLRDARSIAPFDGVIVRKNIEVGDTMQPGQPLLTFADVEYLQVDIDVPARLRPGLREGMMINAELDVTHERVPVRVAQIFPMADPQRHTVKVKLDLPQGIAEPGMYVRVMVPDFSTQERGNPVIPASAIRYNGSLPGVYVLDDQGRPHLRLVRLGERLPDGMVSVLSGLRPGERVMNDPPPGVAAGWSSGPSSPGR